MKNEILDYMVDFEKKKLKRHQKMMLIDRTRIVPVFNKDQNEESFYYNLRTGDACKFKFDNTPIYMKKGSRYSLDGMASSRMYTELGIPTPITYPIKYSETDSLDYYTISQDINELDNPDLDITPAISVPEMIGSYYKNINGLYTEVWDCFAPKIKDRLLTFMTEECFDQMVARSLIDELKTYSDPHFNNYFFYKHKGKKKYEGIIPIDLEQNEILTYAEFPDKSLEERFRLFNTLPYRTYNLTGGVTDLKTHSQRLEDIREQLFSGNLNSDQIDIIRKTINYDLPGQIKHLAEKYNIQSNVQTTYDLFSKLWEKNKKFGNELGL